MSRALLLLALAACGEVDIQAPPPPGPLVLEAPALYPGHAAPLLTTGAQAWERVYLGSSVRPAGAGPCPSLLGGACLGITQPSLVGTTWSNSDGESAALFETPANAVVGSEICFQAAVPRGPGGRFSGLSDVVCGEVQPPETCLNGPTPVRLGTGETTFTALTEGQDLEMIAGPQGGWHMPLALQIDDSLDLVIADLRITHVATGAAMTPAVPLQVPLPLGTCGGDAVDIFGFLSFDALTTAPDPWTSLCGEEIRLDAVVRDLGGNPLGATSLTVIAQPDPSDGPPCAP